jgi:hypothetical protein|tara:strand:- start:1241 stop:1690 length:450 start_codon:yes stop_codon:yes gene_type:complete
MATTNFSGPIKAGSIKEGASTNVGFVSMAQSVKVDIIGASHLNQVCATIPANSQIIDVILNVTVVNNDGGAATISVGTEADADAFIATANVKALATTHGTLDTEATNVGTADLKVLADFTGANGDGTTGAATVTVVYLQDNSVADAVDL